MRKELEAFIEESFAGLPPSPETEQAKAQVRKQLEADAAVYRAKGMAPWAADQHAMMRFGAVAGARESVARLRRRAIRARFRQLGVPPSVPQAGQGRHFDADHRPHRRRHFMGGRRPHGPDPGLVDHLRHRHCYLRHCGRVS